MSTLSILKIDFLEHHKIQIFLSNYNCIFYDMNPKLKTMRFMELRDPCIFKQGKLIGDKIIRWSAYMEITLDEIIFQNNKISEKLLEKNSLSKNKDQKDEESL